MTKEKNLEVACVYVNDGNQEKKTWISENEVLPVRFRPGSSAPMWGLFIASLNGDLCSIRWILSQNKRNKSEEKTTRENSNNKTEVEMILILQVEYSIGYLKNVEVHEYIENSVSILFLIKSIKKRLG